MPKAVFTTKADPTYDDLPEERYHFPRTYLRQVEAARGDRVEAPDERTAIACAVKEYKIPPNERNRLMTRPLHYGLGSPR